MVVFSLCERAACCPIFCVATLTVHAELRNVGNSTCSSLLQAAMQLLQVSYCNYLSTFALAAFALNSALLT